MKSMRPFFIHFYLPLLISFLLLFAICVSPKFILNDSTVQLDANVSLLGLTIPLPIWLEKVWLIRLFLVAFAFVGIFRAVTIDFSKFFPTTLDIDVYFDDQGIKRSLSVFSKEDLRELEIVDGWKSYAAAYDDEVKASLGSLWKRLPHEMPDIEDYSRERLHARGSTSFIVKRVGAFCYRIMSSSGSLTYDWDVPKKPKRSFCTHFELRETGGNHIRPDIISLLKCRCIVLTPEFKQIFSTAAGTAHAPFDHTVIGLTKVILFPFPHFTNTVYLWKLSNKGTVPIGYAVYFDVSEIPSS